VGGVSSVSRVSRDSNSFQECFKSHQEIARVSRVSRACFKTDYFHTTEACLPELAAAASSDMLLNNGIDIFTTKQKFEFGRRKLF